MFRRKEESFEFESESDKENMSMQEMSEGSSEAEETRPASSSSSSTVASAPRPAALAQAPGAAPRAPATASTPSAFRPATPSASASSASSMASSASAPSRPAAPSASASASSASSMASSVSAPASSGAATGVSKTGGKRILTVGNDILLKGEIATCDRLVIEGEVDAKLNDVHTVEIAETGSFRGKAEIEDAEISGVFEGDLVVRNRLTIYSTGKVRGNITFGEIEIERGGELTGTISIVGQSSGKSGKDNKAA